MQKRPGSIEALADWEPIESVWKAGQIGLPQVVRWKKYISDEDGCGGARKQDSLQHSHSISRLGDIVMLKLRRHCILDESFLRIALSVHDEGEGEILEDTLYIDKNIEGDLAEYLAFEERYQDLEPLLYRHFREAFLLQFALKNPENFPPKARRIMFRLGRENKSECHAFDAIERWDYVLFALEEYRERGNEKILVQTLRHQIPHLNRLADEANIGFGEEIWTPQIRSWAENFIAERERMWIEQKGEK